MRALPAVSYIFVLISCHISCRCRSALVPVSWNRLPAATVLTSTDCNLQTFKTYIWNTRMHSSVRCMRIAKGGGEGVGAVGRPTPGA